MYSSFFKILLIGTPYRKYAFLNILFNCFYALFSALSFISLIPMLDVLFKKTKSKTSVQLINNLSTIQQYFKEKINSFLLRKLEEDLDHTLIIVIGVIIFLFFLKNISNYFAIYFISYLKNGIIKDLRNNLYKKLISLPISYFNDNSRGSLMSKMTNDVTEIQTSFLSVLECIIRDPLTILFSIIAMFFISFKLTLFVLFFIPISGYIISKLGKNLKKQSIKIQDKQGDFLSIIDETFNGMKVIKTFNADGVFKLRFKKAVEKYFSLSNKFIQKTSLSSPSSEFLGILVIGILLWFGGRMVLLEETISGTTFIAYIGLAYNILTPAKGISKANYSIRKGSAAADRILEILNIKIKEKKIQRGIVIKKFKKNIVFDKVSFGYDNKNVISELTFKIKKGENIALVGPSGSGKTTIANLLSGFYEVKNGFLTIDDISFNRIQNKSLSKIVSVVTQESILFNDSIYNNLLVGKKNAHKKEIIKASKAAYAHEFIQELPEGYESIIGELGNKLSGGQKQRLTIARALLKNPEILILDEATSALDSESEGKVQKALEKLMLNRTSLIISHRLSTIKKADKIIVLDKGKITDSGNHKELLEKSKYYQNWVTKQQIN